MGVEILQTSHSHAKKGARRNIASALIDWNQAVGTGLN
jgi:hypothetical protein